MSSVDTSHINALGSQNTSYAYAGADSKLLERFESPFAKEGLKIAYGHAVATVSIRAPEFTSLCPKTGQPDFATIVIEYTPRHWLVESKSLKLYLGSFRQVGEFHESCVQRITRDLVELLDPDYMKVRGEFTPRGGIPFWPEVTYWGAPEVDVSAGGTD